jgi:hypothetical protein
MHLYIFVDRVVDFYPECIVVLVFDVRSLLLKLYFEFRRANLVNNTLLLVNVK